MCVFREEYGCGNDTLVLPATTSTVTVMVTADAVGGTPAATSAVTIADADSTAPDDIFYYVVLNGTTSWIGNAPSSQTFQGASTVISTVTVSTDASEETSQVVAETVNSNATIDDSTTISQITSFITRRVTITSFSPTSSATVSGSMEIDAVGASSVMLNGTETAVIGIDTDDDDTDTEGDEPDAEDDNTDTVGDEPDAEDVDTDTDTEGDEPDAEDFDADTDGDEADAEDIDTDTDADEADAEDIDIDTDDVDTETLTIVDFVSSASSGDFNATTITIDTAETGIAANATAESGSTEVDGLGGSATMTEDAMMVGYGDNDADDMSDVSVTTSCSPSVFPGFSSGSVTSPSSTLLICVITTADGVMPMATETDDTLSEDLMTSTAIPFANSTLLTLTISSASASETSDMSDAGSTTADGAFANQTSSDTEFESDDDDDDDEPTSTTEEFEPTKSGCGEWGNFTLSVSLSKSFLTS